jgi:hypothetical protein
LVTILLTITIIGFPYAKITWKLGGYFFWPFGKYIIRQVFYSDVFYLWLQKSVKVDEETALNNDNSGSQLSHTPRKYIYPREPIASKLFWMVFGGNAKIRYYKLISSSNFVNRSLNRFCFLLVTRSFHSHGQGTIFP